MATDREQEKKNRVMGVVTTLAIHGVLIILFIFVVGFTAPDPPLGERGSGVELQLGIDDTGSGDIQQDVPVTPTDAVEEVKTEEASKQQSDAAEPPKEKIQPLAEDKPKEELSSDEESPVSSKEVKKEIKKVQPTEKTREKPIKDPVKEIPKETPKEEKKAVVKNEYKGAATAVKKDGDEKASNSKGVSQGDDTGKTGDKGNPAGVPDIKAAYSGNPGSGGPGGGGSGGISMSGFDGYDRPDIRKPEIPEDSYGTYTFVVKVNAEGDIEKITTELRGNSLEAENIFKKVIQKLQFDPKKENLPASSEGRITFKVVRPKQ